VTNFVFIRGARGVLDGVAGGRAVLDEIGQVRAEVSGVGSGPRLKRIELKHFYVLFVVSIALKMFMVSKGYF
jgi:hypothetical protein